MFIRRKIRELELSLPGQETSSENDLMMMGGGGVQNLVTIPDDTISGWRSLITLWTTIWSLVDNN